jgi:thioredoxin reductase
MELWYKHMPKGMLLRSYWWATNLSDPGNQFGLERYLREELNMDTFDPVPGETIADYGVWFQKHAVPNVDETFIQNIERQGEQFEVTLVDGRVLTATSVILAPGLQPFIYRAPEYDHLPKELVSHTALHRTYDELAGKKVAMIGGGQSAMECSALAYESGVQVELFSRQQLNWIKEGASFPTNRSLIDRILEPKASVAPGWFNFLEETFPYRFQMLPRSTRDKLLSGAGSHGPKGSSWLKPRLVGKVPLHEQTRVLESREKDNGVELKLSTNETRLFDHIVLATGYRANMKRLTLLGDSVLPLIQDYKGAPVLSSRFETTVPNLYLIGYAAHNSCGPCYRFVAGVGAASRRVAETIAQRTRAGKRA